MFCYKKEIVFPISSVARLDNAVATLGFTSETRIEYPIFK